MIKDSTKSKLLYSFGEKQDTVHILSISRNILNVYFFKDNSWNNNITVSLEMERSHTWANTYAE